MNVMFKNCLTFAAFALLLATLVGVPRAATVSLVALDEVGGGGFTGPEWRTAAVAKPNDVDGDNVLGTDGWKWFAYNADGGNQFGANNGTQDQQDLPSYINSTTSSPHYWWAGNGWADFDDPLNVGVDTLGDWAFNDVGPDQTYSITIDRATDDAFRLTVFSSGGGNGGVDQTITVDGGGGDPTVTTSQINPADGDRFYAYFDIGAGTDDIVVTFTDLNQSSNNTSSGLTGFAFDTASATVIPEPSTCALTTLGLFSLGLFGWRRRRMRG